MSARRYVYDGQEILVEYDGSNNILARYTHSGLRTDDVLSVYVTSSGERAGLAQSSGSYYYGKDALGSILVVADSGGNKLQRYVYEGYGTIASIRDASGNDITNNPILNTSYAFAGREWDKESNLYYNRARYYDSSTGRFLQKDPEPGKLILPVTTINSYAYVANNPLSITDPTGKGFLGKLAVVVGSGIAAAFAATVIIGLLGIPALGPVLGGVLGVVVGSLAGAFAGAFTGAIIGGIVGAIDEDMTVSEGISMGWKTGRETGLVTGGVIGASVGVGLSKFGTEGDGITNGCLKAAGVGMLSGIYAVSQEKDKTEKSDAYGVAFVSSFASPVVGNALWGNTLSCEYNF